MYCFLSGNNGFYGFDLLAGVVHGHGGPAPPHPTAPSSAATSVPPNGVSEDYYPWRMREFTTVKSRFKKDFGSDQNLS